VQTISLSEIPDGCTFTNPLTGKKYIWRTEGGWFEVSAPPCCVDFLYGELPLLDKSDQITELAPCTRGKKYGLIYYCYNGVYQWVMMEL
jgi:hypothetical protein